MKRWLSRSLVALAPLVLYAVCSLAFPSPAGVALAADCAQHIESMTDAVRRGGDIEPASVAALRDCLLAQPTSLLQRLDRTQATPRASLQQGVEAQAVVASYQNSLLCLDFNSDGTVSSTNDTWHVLSGSYTGIPGLFTLFNYSGSFYLGGFSSVGLTIGPFSVELFSLAGLVFGSQVPLCPT